MANVNNNSSNEGFKKRLDLFTKQVTSRINIDKTREMNNMKKKRSFERSDEENNFIESLEKEFEEHIDDNNKRRRSISALLNDSTIPNPPERVNSDLIDFIKINLSNGDPYTPGYFTGYVLNIIEDDELPNLPIKVDKDRTLIIKDNRSIRDGFNCTVDLIDKKNNTKTQLLGPDGGTENDFVISLKNIVQELEPVENPDLDEYKYKTWDISYQDLPPDKRIYAINNVYFEMQRSGLFDNNVLNLLYKLMYNNYDINCFACPLYGHYQIMALALMYESNQTPEYENELRDFNKFCSNNFKYKFSNTEFMSLLDAAHHKTLQQVISDPNFEAEFRLLYYFDKAREDVSGFYKFNIDDITFVAKSIKEGIMNSETKLNDSILKNSLYIETKDENGRTVQKKIYSADSNGKIEGSRQFYIDKYNKKHNIKDSSILVDVYMTEVRNAVKDELNLNDQKTLKLKNGDKIEIVGIKYSNVPDYIMNDDKAIAGCELFYIKGKERELIYSDNPARQLGNFRVFKTLIEKAGGLVNSEKSLKKEPKIINAYRTSSPTSDIEEKILKSEYSHSQNAPEELLKKYINNCSKKEIKEIVLKNNKKLLFKNKTYMEGKEKKQAPTVYLTSADGTIENKFIDVVTIRDRVTGTYSASYVNKFEELVEYYKKIEYGPSLDNEINKNISNTKSYSSINNDKSR